MDRPFVRSVASSARQMYYIINLLCLQLTGNWFSSETRPYNNGGAQKGRQRSRRKVIRNVLRSPCGRQVAYGMTFSEGRCALSAPRASYSIGGRPITTSAVIDDKYCPGRGFYGAQTIGKIAKWTRVFGSREIAGIGSPRLYRYYYIRTSLADGTRRGDKKNLILTKIRPKRTRARVRLRIYTLCCNRIYDENLLNVDSAPAEGLRSPAGPYRRSLAGQIVYACLAKIPFFFFLFFPRFMISFSFLFSFSSNTNYAPINPTVLKRPF